MFLKLSTHCPVAYPVGVRTVLAFLHSWLHNGLLTARDDVKCLMIKSLSLENTWGLWALDGLCTPFSVG